MNEFTLLGQLGKGSFGRVYLVFHHSSQQHYAMKSVKKDEKSIYE